MNLTCMFAAAVLSSICSGTSQQADFSALQLKLKVGDTAFVTIGGQPAVRGVVRELSAMTLKIDGYEFHPDQDLRVEREERNSVKRGALIGAGIANVIALLVYPHNGDRLDTAWLAGLLGAGWGSWFAFTTKHRTLIYSTGSASCTGAPSESRQ
jgi:hypothetical protein